MINLRPQSSYFLISDFARDVGFEVDKLIHLAGQGKLAIHVLAGDWLADAFVMEGGEWGVASPKDGVVIFGPVELYPEDVERYEVTGSVVIERLKGNTGGRDQHEPDGVWEYRLRVGIPFSDCKLVVTASAIESLMNLKLAAGKPLGTREKNSLLKMIAALALECGYDLHHASKAAQALEAGMKDAVPSPIKAGAIQEHLEAAFALVDKSKKPSG